MQTMAFGRPSCLPSCLKNWWDGCCRSIAKVGAPCDTNTTLVLLKSVVDLMELLACLIATLKVKVKK
jgi:hypothetical protein